MRRRVNVSELLVYPVKGMQGVEVDSIEITELGIVGDREFTVWEDGHLVDQKVDQWMATIAADYDPLTQVLTMRHPEHGEFVHQRSDVGETRHGTWVIDQFDVIDQGDEVAAWLSGILGREVRLVDAKQPWTINFPVAEMERVHGKSKVRFSAATEVSLANEASLADLNEHLDQPVPMDRFRMNVIIEGVDAWVERQFDHVSNNHVELSHVSTAERCIIVTTDQTTGERPRNNLLRVLRAQHMKPKDRRYGSGMMFGSYLTVDKPGHIAIGDTLVATIPD